MKKKHVTAFVLLLCLLAGCSKSGTTGMETSSTDRHMTTPVQSPAVYMTTDISPEGLKKVYDALGRFQSGRFS